MNKKLFIVAALSVLLVFALSACSQSQTSSEQTDSSNEPTSTEVPSEPSQEAAETAQAPVVQFETLQEAFDAPGEDAEMTYDETRYILGYHDGEWYYRVVANLPEGMKADLDATMMSDNDRFYELLSPLPVTKTDIIPYPTTADVARFEGMTGAELSAEGFDFLTLDVDGNTTMTTASYGSYNYRILFNGTVDDPGTLDIAGAVQNLTVTSISVDCLSWEALTAA